uniref:Uncharacterized protein n=1 Tax=Helianthus annuus TaxID=4232 RepID=A0A251TD78_HELAN
MLFNLPMDHKLMPKCIYAPPLNSLRIICQNWVISAYQNILMRFNNLNRYEDIPILGQRPIPLPCTMEAMPDMVYTLKSNNHFSCTASTSTSASSGPKDHLHTYLEAY